MKKTTTSYEDWYDEFVEHLGYFDIDAPPFDGEDALSLYDEGYSPAEAAEIIDMEYTDSDDDEEPSYF